MRRHPVTTLLVLCLLTAACGDGPKVFGEHSEQCPVTELTNDLGDIQSIADGSDCFMTEFEAGRPVVWDVLVVTVEGDPIPTRYEYDGERVIITTDSTRDAYGDGGVDEQHCDSVHRTSYLPEGVDCSSSLGDGFRSDHLPGHS